MKQIKLTKGKVTLVDDEDFEQLNKYKWYAHVAGYNYYAARKILVCKKYKFVLMHRQIMNAPDGVQVDHRSSDGLFNCKENLRLCTHQQNNFNKQVRKDNKLGIKGVHWSKRDKKFKVQIFANNKVIHLGCFNVLGDADSAYRIAEDKYFGEYSRSGS